MFAAARRPLVQSTAFVNLPLVPAPAPPVRSCHGQAKNGHWQCPTTTTTVESALKREARGAAEASLSPSHARSGTRPRITRTPAAAKGAGGDAQTPPLPLSTAPAAEHAAAHPPEPASDDRDGSPGASSSGGSFEGGAASASAADAHAAVQALRAELLDMRKQAAAQAALTAQQALTISGLERTLQKTQAGGSAQTTGQGAAKVRVRAGIVMPGSPLNSCSIGDVILMTLRTSAMHDRGMQTLVTSYAPQLQIHARSA